MRTTRIVVAAVFIFTSFLLVYSTRRRSPNSDDYDASSRSRGLSSFQTPLSLFPPNAIISLTDDNTTSFLARPAAFGPLLPSRGLSGQLWIGSGFADDVPRLGTIVTGAEGELGCSDVPGWNNEHTKPRLVKTGDKTSAKQAAQAKKSGGRRQQDKIDADLVIDSTLDISDHTNHVDDGTDDYLHEAALTKAIALGKGQSRSSSISSHADIQSIQEGAEIAGKVVLLSRGGCGFSEKANWVQRRGGVALIVGDDTRGGPLIQMFARGDTSNVTIPAIFTSYTTAHLLASLIPATGSLEDSLEAEANIATRERRSTSQKISRTRSNIPGRSARTQNTIASPQRCWFSWARSSCDRSSSKKKEWIRVVEYNEEDDVKGHPIENPAASFISAQTNMIMNNDDDFVIGVQDWRDPDLVQKPSSSNVLSEDIDSTTAGSEKTSSVDTDAPSLLNRIFGEDTDESDAAAESTTAFPSGSGHEGLWITLTPTSAATPFFDTLLVLVVSPLVTLTIVYAMLLIRSRIRRRRWRAPKSVVEQLPVHTYHALPPSTPQTRLPSPKSSSPSTPLLQSVSRPRPRSRTTSGIPEPSATSRHGGGPFQPQTAKNEVEKTGDTSEWRKYMNKQVECVVCLEEYIDGVSRVMSLPCGHEFHVDCITPWLTTRRRTCPICKGDVVRSLAHASVANEASAAGQTAAQVDSYQDDVDDTHMTFQTEGRDLENGDISPTRTNNGAEPSSWRSFLGISDDSTDVSVTDRSR